MWNLCGLWKSSHEEEFDFWKLEFKDPRRHLKIAQYWRGDWGTLKELFLAPDPLCWLVVIFWTLLLVLMFYLLCKLPYRKQQDKALICILAVFVVSAVPVIFRFPSSRKYFKYCLVVALLWYLSVRIARGVNNLSKCHSCLVRCAFIFVPQFWLAAVFYFCPDSRHRVAHVWMWGTSATSFFTVAQFDKKNRAMLLRI